MSPRVTLFLPTYNAGPEFPEILEAMIDQDLDRPFDVFAIDSGSTDGTVEHLKSRDVRLLEIPNSQFNHGLTRDLGLRKAEGEIVVMTVQDARPHDRQWLQRLVDCFEDPEVAGAYSRQLPRSDANPFIKSRLSNWTAAQLEPRVQSIDSAEAFDALEPLEKLGAAAFDNVSSSVRRSVALEIPFRERQFGEDLDWGLRVIQAGYKIVFEPRSAVVHSHDKSIWYEFKRVYLDHQNLHRLLGVHTVPTWDAVKSSSRWEIARLRKLVEEDPELSAAEKRRWQRRAVPTGFTQNLAQYLGARSVAELASGSRGWAVLDRWLRRGV